MKVAHGGPLHNNDNNNNNEYYNNYDDNNNNNSYNNNCNQRRNSRFLTFSSLCHELSPTLTLKWPGCNHVQITCNILSAYHVELVVLRATWYEGTGQLLSLAEF